MHATCPSQLVSLNLIALMTLVNCIHWATQDSSISIMTTATSGFDSGEGQKFFSAS